jgi:hypothetical protein
MEIYSVHVIIMEKKVTKYNNLAERIRQKLFLSNQNKIYLTIWLKM